MINLSTNLSPDRRIEFLATLLTIFFTGSILSLPVYLLFGDTILAGVIGTAIAAAWLTRPRT